MAPSKQEPFPQEIDLNQIFFAREAQLALFRQYLERWKQQMRHTAPSSEAQTIATPDNRLQGLVVLLSGDGGLGKSVLLKHYHQIASETHYYLHAGHIINWESNPEEIGALFDPLPGQTIDALEYFKLLHKKLTWSLGRRLSDFKEYKHAQRVVEMAKEQADNIITSMQKEDRFAALPWLTGEIVVKLVRWLSPRVSTLLELDNEKVAEKVKEYVGKGVEIGVDQLLHVYTRIKTKLGDRLDDYIEPSLRLGLALGHDLAYFAKNYPLVLFFDTTEKVNKGEHYLRMIMMAAGNRVGWAMAGRDNSLEAEPSYAPHMQYGYKDIVSPNCLLPIRFQPMQVYGTSVDVQNFGVDDVVKYFAQLRKQKPSLAIIRKQDAEQIQQITHGVPLAVRLAAAMYVRQPDIRAIIEAVEGPQEIVGQMVYRYLQYASSNRNESEQLYGLALLRRAEEPQVVMAALGLKKEQENAYEETLNQLQWHYSFIFTEQGQPALHPEVRYFLRLWLLQHYKDPIKVSVITRIKEAQQERLYTLEKQRNYEGLDDRFADDEWVETYIDLIEALFWFDIVEGIGYSLSFMLAASLSQQARAVEVSKLGEFFVSHMKSPYNNIWKWGKQSLQYPVSDRVTDIMLESLKELENVMHRGKLDSTSPLAVYHNELEAILWWRLGEAYLDREEHTALYWFQRAIPHLQQHSKLGEDVSRVYALLANAYYDKQEYIESVHLLDETLKIKYDYIIAYYNRGNAYFKLKNYQQAVNDYHYVLLLDNGYIHAYINLGNAYFALKEYQRAVDTYSRVLTLISSATRDQEEVLLDEADIYYDRANAYFELGDYQRSIQDFDHALLLKPTFAWACMNRGNAQAMLQEYHQALADYDRAATLNTKDINIVWMATWANFNKKPIGAEAITTLEAIAQLDAQHYISYICKGIAVGLRERDLKASLTVITQASVIEPDEWDPYFWQGMACAYLGRTMEAERAINKAVAMGLPPVLLTPLYWLETNRPEFFRYYARPLLDRFCL